MSMQTVYQTFLLRSKVYDLYQLIYRNEDYSLHELAQDLLISESTLRRLLKAGRHYLKEYFNLSIQSNPYRYVGNERSIRYFGYQLFTEGYLPGEWPVDEISQQEMDHFIELVAEKLQLQVPYTSLRRLKTLLAVNAIRIQQHHTIKHLHSATQIDQDSTKVLESLSFSDHPFPFELNVENRHQLFFPYSTFVY